MVGCELWNWIENSLIRLRTGKPLIVMIRGRWQLEERSSNFKIKLKYIAYLAYFDIKSSLNLYDSIKVLADYSVMVPLYSSEEYQLYISKFNKYYKDHSSITIYKASGFEKAIEVREKLIDKNIHSFPLIIKSNTYVVACKYLLRKLNRLPNYEFDDYYGYSLLDDLLSEGPQGQQEVDQGISIPETQIVYIGNIVYVNIENKNYPIIVLKLDYELSLDILNKIEELWYEGEFLSLWGQFFYSKYEKLSVNLTKEPLYFNTVKLLELDLNTRL